MGLPARIALPILTVFALVFLGVMAYLLRVGFGTTGAAFGPGLTVAQQGDADLRATPAPIATPGPGTFTVPQTGTGPVAAAAGTLPGQQTGGGTPVGPPAPAPAAISELQARIARNPKDVAALEVLGNLELAAQRFDKPIGCTRARSRSTRRTSTCVCTTPMRCTGAGTIARRSHRSTAYCTTGPISRTRSTTAVSCCTR
jgi:hypothetical protein